MLQQSPPATELRISTSRFVDVFVVTVGGELDLHNADTLREALEVATSAAKPRAIVDLLCVPLLDSTAFGVLVEAAKRVRRAGGAFTIVSDDPRTLRVLEVTGLDRILHVERKLGPSVTGMLDGNG